MRLWKRSEGSSPGSPEDGRADEGSDDRAERRAEESSDQRAEGHADQHAAESSDQRADDAELRRRLTPLQYRVTQRAGTEPPFDNEYWDEHGEGLYVDVVSGKPLFSSRDKYDSRTGWPSFTRPLSPDAVETRTDHKLIMPRSEVLGADSGAHLGHVFADGPAPTGQRYCMNSAALRFIPKERLEEEGYGRYLSLFADDERAEAS